MLALIKAFMTLLPIVKPLVVSIVEALADTRDQEDAAKRLLNEAIRIRNFDKRMRARP